MVFAINPGVVRVYNFLKIKLKQKIASNKKSQAPFAPGELPQTKYRNAAGLGSVNRKTKIGHSDQHTSYFQKRKAKKDIG